MKYNFFNCCNQANTDYDLLMKHGLKSAALFYLDKNQTLMERAAKVLYEGFKNLLPFEVEDGMPFSYQNKPFITGDRGLEAGLLIDETGRIICDEKKFCDIINQYEQNTLERHILGNIIYDSSVPYSANPARHNFTDKQVIDAHMPYAINTIREFSVGNHYNGLTEFIIQHGYIGLIKEINEEMENADAVKASFLRGMLYTAQAFIEYYEKCAAAYQKEFESSNNPDIGKLAQAFKQVPLNPCESFYEGVLIFNIMGIVCN